MKKKRSVKLSKAKFFRFEGTRGDKNQIFRTKDSFQMGRNEVPRNDGINSEELIPFVHYVLSDWFVEPKGSNTGEYLKEVIF